MSNSANTCSGTKLMMNTYPPHADTLVGERRRENKERGRREEGEKKVKRRGEGGEREERGRKEGGEKE